MQFSGDRSPGRKSREDKPRTRVRGYDILPVMPVYHFTVHAYRSWRPDHPRGYTDKGKGYQPPDPDRADDYDRAAKQDPVTFDKQTQEEILIVPVDLAKVDITRTHWPFLRDRRIDAYGDLTKRLID